MERRSPRLTLLTVPNEEIAAAKALYEAALDRRRPAPNPFAVPPQAGALPSKRPHDPAIA